jgi:hypothetical protein
MDNAQSAPVPGASLGRKRRRTVPIVDARFQWKYTLIITALGAGVAAIMGAFLYKQYGENTRILDLEGNVALQQEMMRNDQIFLLYLIVFVLVMGVALAFFGLVVTHRISGPLHMMTRYLSVLASGRYPDLRPLRKHDELHDFFLAFEDAVQGMRNRDLAAIKDLDDLVSIARKAGNDDILRGLERYRQALSESVALSDD